MAHKYTYIKSYKKIKYWELLITGKIESILDAAFLLPTTTSLFFIL